MSPATALLVLVFGCLLTGTLSFESCRLLLPTQIVDGERLVLRYECHLGEEEHVHRVIWSRENGHGEQQRLAVFVEEGEETPKNYKTELHQPDWAHILTNSTMNAMVLEQVSKEATGNFLVKVEVKGSTEALSSNFEASQFVTVQDTPNNTVVHTASSSSTTFHNFSTTFSHSGWRVRAGNQDDLTPLMWKAPLHKVSGADVGFRHLRALNNKNYRNFRR